MQPDRQPGWRHIYDRRGAANAPGHRSSIVSVDGYYEGPHREVIALNMDEAFDAYPLGTPKTASCGGRRQLISGLILVRSTLADPTAPITCCSAIGTALDPDHPYLAVDSRVWSSG